MAAPPLRLPQRWDASPTAAGNTAMWGLLGLSLISVTVRPIVHALHLPTYLVNVDALLTPPVVALVVLIALRAWPRLPLPLRCLTVAVTALAVTMTVSWLLAGSRSFASLALGSAMLLLLPFALYLVAMATAAARRPLIRRTVLLMVLLQLSVGLAQYIALDVAQKAPSGSDLVDGTTSHNFWPVFAIPASMVIVLTGRESTRFLWPMTAVLLAIYSEAKAALMVWLPIMAVLLGWQSLRAARRSRERSSTGLSAPRGRDLVGGAVQAGIVITSVAVVLIGLWWTPSVQGTWGVFVGHSRELEELAAHADSDAGAPDIRVAVTRVSDSLTSDPVAFAFGRGPGNTTSHAAEVLSQGAKNGVALPSPGPIARQLLTGGDDIKFRDAQSSVLGLWGDLGTIGAGIYLGMCGAAAWVIFRVASPWSRIGTPRAWAVPLTVIGILGGGTLLDWQEQAGVVLPVMLATLALCGADRSPPPDEGFEAGASDAQPGLPVEDSTADARPPSAQLR